MGLQVRNSIYIKASEVYKNILFPNVRVNINNLRYDDREFLLHIQFAHDFGIL